MMLSMPPFVLFGGVMTGFRVCSFRLSTTT